MILLITTREKNPVLDHNRVEFSPIRRDLITISPDSEQFDTFDTLGAD